MSGERPTVDVFGIAARYWLANEGKESAQFTIERDDHTSSQDSVDHYVYKGYSSLKEYQKSLLQFIESPILDLGCGAGRFTSALSQEGYTVVGIDVSRGALEVCRTSVNQDQAALVQMSINELGFASGSFPTVIAMGHNVGAVGNIKGLRKLLVKLSQLSTKGGHFVLTSVDVTKLPDLESYYRDNIRKGRYLGQERMRLRFLDDIGDWFDWLFVIPEDLGRLAEETGWKVVEIFHDEARPDRYSAVLENTHS